MTDFDTLAALERRVLWLSAWTIHAANHLRPADDLDLLLNAARLAGVGMHVDYYDRDRHAQYLVLSGDLHGFSHREVVLLASICRWADGGTPDLTPFASLILPDDQRRKPGDGGRQRIECEGCFGERVFVEHRVVRFHQP